MNSQIAPTLIFQAYVEIWIRKAKRNNCRESKRDIKQVKKVLKNHWYLFFQRLKIEELYLYRSHAGEQFVLTRIYDANREPLTIYDI